MTGKCGICWKRATPAPRTFWLPTWISCTVLLLREREKLDYDEFDRFMKGQPLPAPKDVNEEMERLRQQARGNQYK